jgi:hypothetical protein
MTDSTATTTIQNVKPPIAKLRDGLIYANIWARVHDGKTFYSVTFERRFKDKAGAWHSTQSFNVHEVLSLAGLAEQANVEILNLCSGEVAQ